MRLEDFDLFSTLLKQRSGLLLSKDKIYLLESRLLPVARKWGLKSLDELASSVRSRRDEPLLRDITEAMTTNESSFFRDTKPFDQFRKHLLPNFISSRKSKSQLRLWSAASSSGQEAYSLAMILAEEGAKMPGWRLEIIGTDLSGEMVERAKSGIYTQFEVQRGMPITQLVKFFTQQNDKWQINQQLRQMVQFREMNLLGDYGSLGLFDVIFCRNVLIYFDPPTKTQVLSRIAAHLAPDGILYLGGAETVLGVSDKFRPFKSLPGAYVHAQTPDSAFGNLTNIAV